MGQKFAVFCLVLCLTACEKPMTPEEMSAQVSHCHQLGLRAIPIERLVSADRYAVVEIQCKPNLYD